MNRPNPLPTTGRPHCRWRRPAGLLLGILALAGRAETQPHYHSPWEVAFSPNGTFLAVSDRTTDHVALIEVDRPEAIRTTPLNSPATGLAWEADSQGLWVAEYDSSSVVKLEAATGQVACRLDIGPKPMGLAMAPRRGLLLATHSATKTVTLVDTQKRSEMYRIRVSAAPWFLCVSPDESLAVVGHFISEGNATDPQYGASLSVVNLATKTLRSNIPLPPGSALVRQVTISPNNQWAYAAHIIGRFFMPVTQLERGWINGNAISIIDLQADRLYATILLDRFNLGAADPWGLCLSRSGDRLWTTLSGTHRLAEINLAALHSLLAGSNQFPLPGHQDSVRVWEDIRQDPRAREQLVNDLDALPKAGVLQDFSITGKSPRGLALSADGRCLAVAAFHSGQVLLIDPDRRTLRASVSLGIEPEPDLVRQGEIIFHDATYSFQHWLSCGTCHPEGRTDGLNWDLVNDGVGNPKNTRSLLLSHRTPPMMSLGVRANMEIAVASGFRFSLFGQPKAEELQAVRAYLRSLQPERSPYRSRDGELSALARQGQQLFADPATGCARCHPPPLFTDRRLHNVGTHLAPEPAADFDTPTLIEVWRTAPYLHHGAATNLQEVFTRYNPTQRHGSTAHLSPAELEALVEYVLSL